MTLKQIQALRAKREEQLAAAMLPLVGDERFIVFMDLIRDLREGAVGVALAQSTVESSLKTAQALGAVGAYDEILAVFRGHSERAAGDESSSNT